MMYDRSRSQDAFFEFARQHIDELRDDAARGRELRRAVTDHGSTREAASPDEALHDDEARPFGG